MRPLLAIAAAALGFVATGGASAETLPTPAELADLIGTPPARVTVYEPHLATDAGPVARDYLAHPFPRVADALFGPGWRKGADGVEFWALDGYVSRIPLIDFAAHAAHLAVGLAEGGPFTVDNLLQNETAVPLGPYYLVWENIDDGAIFARGASIWPYQVAEMLPVLLSDAALMPEGLDPALLPAVALTKTHCLNCHRLNG